jgi:hypothetical protein
MANPTTRNRQSHPSRALIAWMMMSSMMVIAIIQVVAVESAVTYASTHFSSSSVATAFDLRGGATSSKKKKKKNASAKKDTEAASAVVNQVLKEKDAAQALGDAIRDRADQLRHETDDYFGVTAAQKHIQESMQSVGWAMGASDSYVTATTASETTANAALSVEDGAGGVEAAPASVVVHYFLKSHGGAHALQCVCSLLAATAGLGSICCKGSLQLTLLKRCLLFAMIKHVSGLVAASCIAATGIPDTGFRQAVRWMQELATDPVSQYVFYAATVLFWLPSTSTTTMTTKPGATTSTTPPIAVWWQAYLVVPVILVGPVILRELISTALVVSDVLVLTACSSSNTAGIKRLLTISLAIVNACMSLLVTPTVWRSATAAQRQAILAKLTSKLSLAMEVAVGVLMGMDAVISVIGFLFTAAAGVKFGRLVKSLVCTRLYLQFLWTRRRKIHKLAATVRGGAGAVPLYVLSVLMDPQASMGLAKPDSNNESRGDNNNEWTWKDYARIALGLDE